MPLYASQTPLIRKDAGNLKWREIRSNFRQWGWKGPLQTAGKGALAAIGLSPNAAGKMRFLGGKWAPTGGFAGVGIWALTGDPLLGAGIGLGTSMGMAGGIRSGFKAFGKGMIPGFTLMGAIEGFREGGLGGAAFGAAKEVAIWSAFDLAIEGGKRALGPLWRGSRVAAAAGGVGRFMSVGAKMIGPIGLIASAAYLGYKALKGLGELGRERRRIEFAGDMSAFMTEAGWTMRQRSLQEIQRSHTNSRTILGREAAYMHR